MKKLLSITLILSAFYVSAQTSKINKLLGIEEDVYTADREIAFIDPYVGLKKLI
jgi:hypothetical protein